MGRRTKARECAFQMLYQWTQTRRRHGPGASTPSGACAHDRRDARDGGAAGPRRRRRASQSSTRPSHRGRDSTGASSGSRPSIRTILRLGRVRAAGRRGGRRLRSFSTRPWRWPSGSARRTRRRSSTACSTRSALDAGRASGTQEGKQWHERARSRPRSRAGRRSPPSGCRRREALRTLGVEPYPTRFERTRSFVEIIAAYGEKTLEELEALARRGVDRRAGDDEARARQGLLRDAVGRRSGAPGLRSVGLGGRAGLPALRPRRPRRLRGRVGNGNAHAQGRALRPGAAS